jgi:hypothetical protein
MSCKLYKWNGRFIEGKFLSQHKTQALALKRAKKEIEFKFSVKEKQKNETLIWLDDENHSPVGVIVCKK